MSDIQETWKREQGQIVVCRSQDVSAYLEQNRRERDEMKARKARGYLRPMRKVAEIPNIVVEQWLKEDVNIHDRNHAKEVQRRLNSPEWAYLRTSPGKMAMKV